MGNLTISNCIGVIGLEKDGLIEALQCSFVLKQIEQCAATIVVCFRIFRIQADGPLITPYSGLILFEGKQGVASIAMGLHIIWIQTNCLIEALQRGLWLLHRA